MILLDALGTLLELEPPAPALAGELQRRFGISLTEAEAAKAIAAEISYYRGHLDDGRDDQGLARLRRRCAEALHAGLPRRARELLPDASALVEPLLASLRFRLFADVRPALLAYRARGIRLVVVSNWDVSLHGVLARLGLGELLDAVLTSAEAGARKPAAEIFEQALRLAQVPADQALHVGDSLREDVAGARAAGIEPVLLRRDGEREPGVRTITSLAAVLC